MKLTYGSVCSGIEAASVAWESLGFEPAWFSQFDPEHNYRNGPDYPSSVLAHHWPHVENLGDMTRIAGLVRFGEVAAPDILVGGTPCQSFSIAGMRAGLTDERGQLALSYVELADAIDSVRAEEGKPSTIVIWENVPGVLSSKDNAFGCFLAALAGDEEPYPRPTNTRGKPISWSNSGVVFGPKRAIAWRVVDAQYFGLAQRRRRVFLIASAREDFHPAQVLLEFDGLRRDSAPRREAGQGFAADIAPSLVASGRGVERIGETRGQDPVIAVHCLAHGQGGGQSSGLTAARP